MPSKPSFIHDVGLLDEWSWWLDTFQHRPTCSMLMLLFRFLWRKCGRESWVNGKLTDYHISLFHFMARYMFFFVSHLCSYNFQLLSLVLKIPVFKHHIMYLRIIFCISLRLSFILMLYLSLCRANKNRQAFTLITIKILLCWVFLLASKTYYFELLHFGSGMHSRWISNEVILILS